MPLSQLRRLGRATLGQQWYKTVKERVDDILNGEEFDAMIKPTTDAWANFFAVMKQIAPYYDPKGASDIHP
jgi:hypothetical protein